MMRREGLRRHGRDRRFSTCSPTPSIGRLRFVAVMQKIRFPCTWSRRPSRSRNESSAGNAATVCTTTYGWIRGHLKLRRIGSWLIGTVSLQRRDEACAAKLRRQRKCRLFTICGDVGGEQPGRMKGRAQSVVAIGKWNRQERQGAFGSSTSSVIAAGWFHIKGSRPTAAGTQELANSEAGASKR